MSHRWEMMVCALFSAIVVASSGTSLFVEAAEDKQQYKACAFPGTPWHGLIVEPSGVDLNQRFPHNTTVRYSCDPGYTLIGSATRTCLNGRWPVQPPECLRDMALEKPAFLSSEDEHSNASFAVDHERTSCAVSAPNDVAPMWGVNIIESTDVKFVHVEFGLQASNMSIEVRVGYHYPTTGSIYNAICKRVSIDVMPGFDFYFRCPDHTHGRFVSVQVKSPPHQVNLCKVRVLSTKSISEHDACPDLNGHPDALTGSFSGRCVELFRKPVKGAETARSKCEALGGHLPEMVDQSLEQYINWYTLLHLGTDTSVWLGAKRKSTRWSWFNGEPIVSFYVANENPNTTVAPANCLTMAPYGWRPRNCAESHYVVCLHNASSCGTLPTPERTANWHELDRVAVNATSKVLCEESHYLDGDEIRCFANGSISQTKPVCLPFGCSVSLENGTVARVGGSNLANFSCNPGFLLGSSGGAELRCIDGNWSSLSPVCLADTTPGQIIKGTLDGVHEIEASLHEISVLTKVPTRIMDALILAIIIGAVIIAIVLIGLAVYWMYHRKQRSSAQVTLTELSAKTGA